MVLHAALCHETRTKIIMKAITNRTRVHEFIYARLIDQLSLPPPWVGSLLTHRIERRLRTTDAREPKSGALLDRFFLENARKKFHSQFTFSILSPSFVTENRPSLSFSLFSLSRELLRTFANKFLIFFHSP